MVAAFVVISLLVVVAVIVFASLWHKSYKRYSPDIKGDVLFVFAHPDDEAMFFSPLLMYLKRINVKAHFLCLSNGNFGGLGLVREKELVASAAYYGIPPHGVTTINDERLPDGMKSSWDAKLVAQIIRHTIASVNANNGGSSSAGGIKTVVTFDCGGVSYHPNHIATYEGVRVLAEQQKKEDLRPLVFLQLRTRSLFAKYAGPLALIPFFFSESSSGHPNSFEISRRKPSSVHQISSSAKTTIEGRQGEDEDEGESKVVQRSGTDDSDPTDVFSNEAAGSKREAEEPEEYASDIVAKRKTSHKNSQALSQKGSEDNAYRKGKAGFPWAVIVKPSQSLSSLEGLKRHTSQLVWFRYLFVFFSTYGYVNEYTLLD